MIVFLYSFLGAVAGSFIANLFTARQMGKQMTNFMVRDINEYMKKEEEALNNKIQRKKF